MSLTACPASSVGLIDACGSVINNYLLNIESSKSSAHSRAQVAERTLESDTPKEILHSWGGTTRIHGTILERANSLSIVKQEHGQTTGAGPRVRGVSDDVRDRSCNNRDSLTLAKIEVGMAFFMAL
jgi:hypothetical protein